jgi:hypothetical protein
MVVCLSNIANYRIFMSIRHYYHPIENHPSIITDRIEHLATLFKVLLDMLLLVVPPVLGMIQPLVLKLLPRWLQHAISISSSLVAILLMVPSIALFTTKNTTAKWILFAVLCLPVLLITISRLPFPIISRLMDRALDTKKISDSEILHVCCASDVGVHA